MPLPFKVAESRIETQRLAKLVAEINRAAKRNVLIGVACLVASALVRP